MIDIDGGHPDLLTRAGRLRIGRLGNAPDVFAPRDAATGSDGVAVSATAGEQHPIEASDGHGQYAGLVAQVRFLRRARRQVQLPIFIVAIQRVESVYSFRVD